MIVKNRDAPGGKEFWDHVEKVAKWVREHPELVGHRVKNYPPEQLQFSYKDDQDRDK